MLDKTKFEQINASIEGGAATLEQVEAKQRDLADGVANALAAQEAGKIELAAAESAYDEAIAAGEEYLKSIERGHKDSPPAPAPTGSPDPTGTAEPLV